MGHTLRVASYNLRDLLDDVQAAARVVRAINPDVLCLQEVPRYPLSSKRIGAFAARCGLSWSGGHRGSGGTTMMSGPRMDLADVRHSRLKVARLQRERGYAVGQVRLPGQRSVGFVSIHLSLDAAERAEHAATVLAALPALPWDGLLVLAGDLNEGPDGQAWRSIAERLRVVSGDAPTFPANNPRHRLDAIFASAVLQVLPVAAGDPVVLNPADLVAASDHRPVWVDLDLTSIGLR